MVKLDTPWWSNLSSLDMLFKIRGGQNTGMYMYGQL